MPGQLRGEVAVGQDAAQRRFQLRQHRRRHRRLGHHGEPDAGIEARQAGGHGRYVRRERKGMAEALRLSGCRVEQIDGDVLLHGWR